MWLLRQRADGRGVASAPDQITHPVTGASSLALFIQVFLHGGKCLNNGFDALAEPWSCQILTDQLSFGVPACDVLSQQHIALEIDRR